MPLVTAYKHLQKKDQRNRFVTFTPLRAVGLSLELGWKLARDRGLSAVTAGDLRQVHVSGELRIKSGERWRAARTCDLELRVEDANLAEKLLVKQRGLLTDLRINVWAVDCNPGGRRSVTFDLVGDFSGPQHYGVTGKLWVELKVFSEANFEQSVETCKADLKEKLTAVRRQDATIGGVILVAAKVDRVGSGWSTPVHLVTLLVPSASGWAALVGGSKRPARGQCGNTKLPLAKLWEKMEWHQATDGRVGLLSHFLAALDLDEDKPGDRATTFNQLLRKQGHAGRVYNTKLPSKAGRKPWVASKDTFRALYHLV